VVLPKRIVAWTDGDVLNPLELLRWTWPDSRFPREPRVTRMGLNTHVFHPPKTLLRRFGFDEWSRPQGSPRLRLEWSVLGEELLASVKHDPASRTGQATRGKSASRLVDTEGSAAEAR